MGFLKHFCHGREGPSSQEHSTGVAGREEDLSSPEHRMEGLSRERGPIISEAQYGGCRRKKGYIIPELGTGVVAGESVHRPGAWHGDYRRKEGR